MQLNIETLVLPAIVSILLAIPTSYISFLFYKRQIKEDLRKEYLSRFNERKWETYTEFSKLVVSILTTAKQNQEIKPEEYTSRLFGFTGSLWIVGSDRVVQAWADWLKITRSANETGAKPDPYKVIGGMIKIIKEMRIDLGYTDDKVDETDLIGTFITDYKPTPRDITSQSPPRSSQ